MIFVAKKMIDIFQRCVSISSGIDASELARDVLPWIFRDQRYPMCAWGYNKVFLQRLSMVQWSPVFYHVLWSSVWHMEGKTLDQHTHTPCLLVKHFHNSPGSESLGATGGDSGTWSMWGNNKIWKFTSETVWNIWISIFQPMKTFHFIGFACVLCINAYCIEKNGVLDPWQLGWLAIRRWDFKPDTRRGFGIYNAVIAYIL